MCILFDGKRFNQIERGFHDEVCIGDVKVYADEKEILKLNPSNVVFGRGITRKRHRDRVSQSKI